MVYVLALAASLVNALTSVLQRLGVQNAPADAALRLSLLTHALRRGVWLLGFALMIVSFVVQAVALHIGRLSEVQPILTTELVFLAAILAIWFRFRIGRREWLGAIAVAGGLSGFLYFAHPQYGMTPPAGWRWAVAGGVCAAIIVVAVSARHARAALVAGHDVRHRGVDKLRLHRGLHEGRLRLRLGGLDPAVPALADLRAGVLRRARGVPDPERDPRRAARRLPVDSRTDRPAGQHLHRHRSVRRRPADRRCGRAA